jgi:hypothetical protein
MGKEKGKNINIICIISAIKNKKKVERKSFSWDDRVDYLSVSITTTNLA